VAWTSDATVCTGGTLNSGRGASGFSADRYWSSSESAASSAWYHAFSAWYQVFDDGDQGNLDGKGIEGFRGYVRPVRAF
jgi:hypothetical protein